MVEIEFYGGVIMIEDWQITRELLRDRYSNLKNLYDYCNEIAYEESRWEEIICL